MAHSKGDEGLGGSHMDDLGYAPIWLDMLGDTQLIDCSRGNDSSAKSSNCLLVVAQKSQWARKTHDHTKAKKRRHAQNLVAMKSKVEDVDVLGIVVDGAMFNQVVNDVHEGAVNVPTKVEGKAPFQVTKE